MVTLPCGALVGADDDGGGGVAAVGIFHLRVHAGGAEIHFGADAGAAQLAGHLLVVGDGGRVAVEDEDDDRTGVLVGVEQLPVSFSALARRDTPMEKPVAGTGSVRKRETRPS